MSDVLSYVFFFVFIFEELVHDMNNPMSQKPRKECICIRKNTVDTELSISTALSTVLGFLALYMFTSIYIHTHTNPDIYMIPVWDRGRHLHAYTYTDPYTYTYTYRCRYIYKIHVYTYKKIHRYTYIYDICIHKDGVLEGIRVSIYVIRNLRAKSVMKF